MDNQGHSPLLLSTVELLETYWPQVEPLLATGPVSEEYPPDVVLQAALTGQMMIFVVKEDSTDVVDLAVVLAPTPSKTIPSINVLTVAGRNLRKHLRQFWPMFKGWCYMNGARAIDAYVPDRMEEFVKKELGLTRETVHVRLRL